MSDLKKNKNETSVSLRENNIIKNAFTRGTFMSVLLSMIQFMFPLSLNIQLNTFPLDTQH